MTSSWEARLQQLRAEEERTGPSAAEIARQEYELQAREAAKADAETSLRTFMGQHGDAACELLRRVITGESKDREGVVFGVLPGRSVVLTWRGIHNVPGNTHNPPHYANIRHAVEAYAHKVNQKPTDIVDIVYYVERELNRIASQAK